MRQSPAANRTGIQRTGDLGGEMIAATLEFSPTAAGTSEGIAAVRVAYAQEGESLGETPPPESLADKAKSALVGLAGGQPTLLMDKLGERLAFERTGARLYEALLSKHQAFGTFDGGPSPDDLLEILSEEYAHAELLQRAIAELGGDPTAISPAANLAATISSGIPHVLADPRSNLLQSLEAILVAELSDNECWTTLEQLARQATYEDLAGECREALVNERDHLRRVRQWIAAGQGRSSPEGDVSESLDELGPADEFSFKDDSRVDAEGFAVSKEQDELGEAPQHRRQPPKRRRRNR